MVTSQTKLELLWFIFSFNRDPTHANADETALHGPTYYTCNTFSVDGGENTTDSIAVFRKISLQIRV